MKETHIAYVQAECRIIYGVDENGEQVISTTYVTDGVEDACPDYFTGTLMHEIARHNFLRRHQIFEPGVHE